MIAYEIKTNGASSQLVIELSDDGIYVESAAVAYVVGNIKLIAGDGKFANKFKAFFIGKQYFKPILKGTGKIYLKATLGSYYKFNVKKSDQLIIVNHTFIACADSIEIIPQIKITAAKFLSGAPLINNLISGDGEVIVQMPGLVVEEKLNNSKFVAYNSDLAAYLASLTATRETAGNGWLNIAYKTVQVFRGTGSVFFVPHPNKNTRSVNN